jgi:hypothetical protein
MPQIRAISRPPATLVVALLSIRTQSSLTGFKMPAMGSKRSVRRQTINGKHTYLI